MASEGQAPSAAPTWCWSTYRGATCLIGGEHAPHAGRDLEGNWLSWTHADEVEEVLSLVESELGIAPASSLSPDQP